MTGLLLPVAGERVEALWCVCWCNGLQQGMFGLSGCSVSLELAIILAELGEGILRRTGALVLGCKGVSLA
jgi:hypothetical protein